MNERSNPSLRSNAQTLRKNMTRQECRLWYEFLRQLPVPVHRQKVIGRYIVDFYCARARLVIELDGSQHYEARGAERDRERDEALRGLGLTVLRYSNLDLDRNFRGVCEDILRHVEAVCPSLSASRSGEQGE